MATTFLALHTAEVEAAREYRRACNAACDATDAGDPRASLFWFVAVEARKRHRKALAAVEAFNARHSAAVAAADAADRARREST